MLRKRYGGVVFWHARKWICQQPRGNAGTPDGTFSYTYDGNNNLDEVTRPDTKTTAYHYENGSFLNALTGITDAASIRFSSYGYNGSGKAILSEHAGNAGELNVSYNGADSTTTNALGKDTTYNFKNLQVFARPYKKTWPLPRTVPPQHVIIIMINMGASSA